MIDQDRILKIDIKQEMQSAYIDYSMSVIVARALPDVRDGFKPVHRRVLFGMDKLGNTSDKPYKKSARIVGDVLGKYHPHGDSSVYFALVRMAQPWSLRYPLVDGQGNFGSVDGDSPAAMRYTEARLSRIAEEMLRDIEKDTVDFTPNFDNTLEEPTVLPTRIPNLLVNGASGIAVGMATNMPPHNLSECIDASVALIDDRELTVEDLMQYIKAPDFPTGGIIYGFAGVKDAFETGRGRIVIRAKAEIEVDSTTGRETIVVSEIPYAVNKSELIKKIADLVEEKRLEGISNINDESDRAGMRIVIEVKRDANASVILNKLFKMTDLQSSFSVNNIALVNGRPQTLNLKQLLEAFVDHRHEVVIRRTRFDLAKAEERAHILEGLIIASDHIDEVVKLIRSSRTREEAKTRLMERFSLSEKQAQAIVDMRLRALTGLEREKLEKEYRELMELIKELKAILADEKLLLGVIKEEILIIATKYGDDRRTSIGIDMDDDITVEDLIPKENVVIAMTKLGYVKRMTINNFKSQNRGGKGIKGMQTIEDDFIENLFMTTTHHYIMFFTNQGRVYRLKTYEIPESGRTARGTAIVNLLQLQPDEVITAVIPIREYHEGRYLIMATKNGMIKKTKITEYANVRKSGLAAITLKEGDELIEVKATNNTKDIILITKQGMCIRFNEKEVRSTGRTSMGVIGMSVAGDDEVIGMQLDTQGEALLIVSENGLGKRTLVEEFTPQHRGGKGVKCYKITDKSGTVVGFKAVNDDNEIMLITNQGIVIRLLCKDISILGRITTGVKLINMDLESDITVASIAKVRQKSADESESLEMMEREMNEADNEEGNVEEPESPEDK